MFARSVLIATALSLVASHSLAQTATPTANANAPVTRGEFNALVREALIKDPEMLADAIKVLHDRQQESADKEAKAAIDKYKDELFKDSTSPSIGAKDANVTVVEFFDYHCGYCKRMLPAITELTAKDKKVRVVFREFPILSEDSVLASRAAIAVHKVAPSKYFDFHSALMKASGKFDEQMLEDTAKKLGVDTAKYKAAFESKETTAVLDKNREMAEALGIRGTPAIVLPGKVLPGAVKFDALQDAVDDVRQGK